MQSRKLMVPLVAAIVLSSSAAYAEKLQDSTARGGVMRCGGNSYLRLGGTESQTVSYTMRNLNEDTGIVLERMRAFDATGAVVFDSNVSGIPLSANGIVGPSGNVIPANATIDITSVQMVGFLDEAHRPIQLEVQWSAPRNALLLHITANRIVRGRDPATGFSLEERSRHALECRHIALR